MTITWDNDITPYAGMSLSIAGGAIESPRSMSNEGNAIDVSGGGYWKIELRRVQLFGGSTLGHKMWMRYRAELDGGAGKIVVPIISEIISCGAGSVTFSGGESFSGGASFVSSDVTATIEETAALMSGTVTIRVASGSSVVPDVPAMFSIYHPSRGWRAYQIRAIDETTTDGADTIITATIRPALREQTESGTAVNFTRPKCVFRLPAGGSMPWSPEKFWHATPSVTLYEAMR